MKNLISVLLILIGMTISIKCHAQTIITKDIDVNTVWDNSGSPYVISTEVLRVNEGITLTIKPNVVVKLRDWRTVIEVNGI